LVADAEEFCVKRGAKCRKAGGRGGEERREGSLKISPLVKDGHDRAKCVHGCGKPYFGDIIHFRFSEVWR